MLVTLTFLLFNAPVLYAAKVIFCQDPSIRYSPGWYAGYSTPTQDIYLETNDTDAASLRLVLPSNATSVEYVGYKRAGGSLYGYCIDCENDGSYELQTVNASDPSVGTDEAAALQSIIFTMTLDPSKQHTLVVYNLPDQQFNNSGTINLDHLLVQVPDSNVPDETTADSPPLNSIPTSSSALSIPTAVVDTGAATAFSASATPSPSSNPSLLPSSTSIRSTIAVHPGSISPSTAVSTAPPSPTIGDANSVSSSPAASKSSAGLSKSMTIGVAVLLSVLGISIIVGLVVFLRQRREQRRNRFEAAQSPRASIIPIMPPPPAEMRTASANPFADPVPRVESPAPSSPMQRRMESRNASPTEPPSIPLPEPPSSASRSDSASSSFARSDLWIGRPVQTPLRSKFSV